MTNYSFQLTFRLPDPNTDGGQYLDALYKAGCSCALFGIGRNKGSIGGDFTRESESLDLAIESAIQDVEQAIPGAQVVKVADDYTYKLDWHEPDKEFVGTCVEFPGLSWLDPDRHKALKGIRKVVADVLQKTGEIQEPIPKAAN